MEFGGWSHLLILRELKILHGILICGEDSCNLTHLAPSGISSRILLFWTKKRGKEGKRIKIKYSLQRLYTTPRPSSRGCSWNIRRESEFKAGTCACWLAGVSVFHAEIFAIWICVKVNLNRSCESKYTYICCVGRAVFEVRCNVMESPAWWITARSFRSGYPLGIYSASEYYKCRSSCIFEYRRLTSWSWLRCLNYLANELR